MILNSGLPRTTMMSASLPGSIVPRSCPRPRMRAPMRVAAEIARCGDIPMSTCALISRHIASGLKFIGEPESVPMPSTAPASMNCFRPRSRKNISRSTCWKYPSVCQCSNDFCTSSQRPGSVPKSALSCGSCSRSGKSTVAGKIHVRCVPVTTTGRPALTMSRISSGVYGGVRPAEPAWVSTSTPASSAFRTSFSSYTCACTRRLRRCAASTIAR